MAKKPKGSVVLLPAISPTLAADAAYLGILREMLRTVASWSRDNLVPAYERELELSRGQGITQDAEGFVWTAFEALLFGVASIALDRVRDVFGGEAKRNTKGFIASAKRILGIDLAVVVREEDLGDYLIMAAERNANLITGMADDLRKRIRDRTIQAVLDGESVASYRKVLAKEFGLSDRRAKVIARDQVSKLTSDLNRIRQQQAGITEYSWQTAQDERVRPLHQSLDGKVYRYGQPTGAEQGLPPGQPILCRCIARGVLRF